MHRRIRVYLMVPDPSSKREKLDQAFNEMKEEILDILGHPIYGETAREFIEKDLEKELLDPPDLPDLPSGLSERLARFHNDLVKRVYRFYKPSKEKTFMVRVPFEDKDISREVENFFKESRSFDEAIEFINKIVGLGIVKRYEIWARDVVQDLRQRFLEIGLDPRELEEYYHYKRDSLDQ